MLVKTTDFSRIIAGVMTWGAWGKNLSTKEIAKKISDYLELGITTFDNADIYGGYTTEAAFGEGLKVSGIDRKSIQIITKCGIKYPSDARSYNVKHYDLSPAYIKLSVEESLKNLKTEYLDLLLLHRPSPLIEVERVAEVVEELKEAGKILSFGVSNFTSSQLSLLLSKVDVDANQIEISLSHYEPMNSGILEYHKLCDIITMAWAPLGKVYKDQSEQSERILKNLEPIAKKYEVSVDQLLIAWLLKHPSNIYPVIGTTDSERAKKSVDALKINLKTEDWFEMFIASQGHKVP